ncbi:MAG: hypothetical protein J6V49_02575, partial [Bacteroidales bacterium]|nr:hypothetical protein [Bacteroidales bacterium]
NNLKQQDAKEESQKDTDATQVGNIPRVDFSRFFGFVKQRSFAGHFDDAGHRNARDNKCRTEQEYSLQNHRQKDLSL